MGHVARERKHQCQGVLSRGDGVALGGVHHQHTALGGGGHIDVVDAHAGAANDPQLVGRFDDVGGHRGARTDHQAVVLTNDGLELLRRQAGAHIDCGHLGEDVDPRLVNGIGDQNLRHARRGGGRAGCEV